MGLDRLSVLVRVLLVVEVGVLSILCEERSLFDDLPLNGAYSPEASGIKLIRPPQKPLDVKFAVRNRDNNENDPKKTTTTTPIQIPTLEFGDDWPHKHETDDENSLFNELRDQAATGSDEGSREQRNQPPHVSTTQKRSFESSSSGSRGFGGGVTNYFTSFFDSKKESETAKATASPTPVEFRIHSPPGATTVLTSSGVRVPLIVRNRGNESNVYDANVSPQHEHFAIPVITRQISTTPLKGEPHVYNTPLYSTPEHKSRDYDASHHYFPSKTKVQSYPISQQQHPQQRYVYSKDPEIVYGSSLGQVQRGYVYPPPPPTTTTSTTTTTPPVTRPPARPRPTPTLIPVITGNPSQAPVYPDYDYETLDDRPNQQFGARTGSFSVTLDGGIGLSHSKTAHAHSPSYTYTSSAGWSEPEQLKPVHIPQPAYGPPPSYEPSATYGPPPPPEVHPPAPPPPVQAPASPPATAVTSISYQTIPIQTVHTQLVTVPHITVSSSSAVESESSQDTPAQQRPARPPTSGSGGWGPSGYDSNANTNNVVTKKSGSLFTDDQIAALLAFNHGVGGDSSVYASRETDALSLLTAQAQQGLGQGRGGLQGLGLGLGFGLDDDLRGLGQLGLGLGDNLQLQQQAQLPNLNLARSRLPSLFRQQQQPRQIIPPAQHPLRVNSLRNGNNNGLYKRNVADLLARQRYADSFGTLPGQPLLLDANRYGTGAGGTILTKDAIQAVNDLVQEQRLRGAVNDLRTRLEYEGRSAARARENYKSLFYKGALLLSALTLIPTLASPIASAAVAQNALNAASPLGHLLPLATGRRKRSIVGPIEDHIHDHSSLKFEDCSPILRNSSFGKWLSCAENATAEMFQNKTDEPEQNPTASLFDALPFNGALIPESIRANLVKYLPAEEIKRNSQCIQKRFCETLKRIETLPRNEAESILFIYSIFAGDIDANPWIHEAMTGGRNNKCGAFYCFEDYQHPKDTDTHIKTDSKE